MDDAQRRRQAWLICLGLALGVFAVYAPLWRAGFITYDDPLYVTANPNIQDGLSWQGLAWAFTTRHASIWHPLTWLSYLADFQMYGMSAAGFHLTNVLLHGANSILLFILLDRMTGARRPSALTAALFALHPMHVESVAWVSERKDVLSTLFWILSVAAYVRRVKSSAPEKSKRAVFSMASVFLFACGLMAKPMLVTLPFILLLLDYWPLQRRETPAGILLAEKMPYFLLAAASCAITYIVAQRAEAVESLAGVSWASRLENIPVSYLRYIAKTFWPSNLAVMYPYQIQWPAWEIAGATALLALMTAWVIWGARARPYCVTGWFWFLIMLAPVIGLVRVGSFAMADRYSYLSSTGLFIMLIWPARGKPRLLGGAAIVAIAGCLTVAALQVRYWMESESLYRRALAVTKRNPAMENALGKVLFEKGRVDEALAHLQLAVRFAPDYPPAHFNLANALLARGRAPEALAQFEINAALQPGDAIAQFVFGKALLEQGLARDAIPHLEKAVQLHPEAADGHYQLAQAWREAGDAAEAIGQYEKTLEIDPGHVPAESGLAWMLATTPAASLRNGARAVQLAQLAEQASKGRDAGILGILAAAYAERGDFTRATATATRALQLAGADQDSALAGLLRAQLARYGAGLPFRDTVK